MSDTLGIFHKPVKVKQGEDFGITIEFASDLTISDLSFKFVGSENILLHEITDVTNIEDNIYYAVLPSEVTTNANVDYYKLQIIVKINGSQKLPDVEKFIEIVKYDKN